MAKSNTPIPPGFRTVTPHLCIKDAAKAIEFYKKAFGAEELIRMPMPDGRLMHACIRIGDSQIMLVDEFPEFDCGGGSPQKLQGAHATMHIFVEDVDAAFDRAVKAGATPKMPVADMFWGDRYGVVVDPFGQPWSIATHKEDLSPDELKKRMAEACQPAAEAAKV